MKNFEKFSKEHASYIKNLVYKAGQVDKERKTFGSQTHNYCLNPTISLDKIQEFEKKHNITLPKEYVFFLTMVGDGGAGPYYGISSFDKISNYCDYQDILSKDAFINDSLSIEKWNNFTNNLHGDEEDEEDNEDLYKLISSGLLVIGTQGCTYDNLLMLNGSEQGKIVYIDWNLEEDYMPFLTNMTFLEWYENFFLEIISNHKTSGYGYVPIGSEKELINNFKISNEENKENFISSFLRFNNLSDETIKFLLSIDEKKLDVIRLKVLLKFAPSIGLEIFDEMIKGKNKECAYLCASNLPEDKKDIYYKDMVNLLYTLQIKDKSSIIFFLKDCSNFSAKDIVKFCLNENNSEDNRRCAVWAMGLAKDKMDVVDDFISLMESDKYWVAHASLQAMAREKNEKLLNAFKTMWTKYLNDSTMRSNLIVAFNTFGIKK